MCDLMFVLAIRSDLFLLAIAEQSRGKNTTETGNKGKNLNESLFERGEVSWENRLME